MGRRVRESRIGQEQGPRRQGLPGGFVLLTAAMLSCFAPSGSKAQDTGGDHIEYATGMLPPTKEEIEAVKPPPLTRAFLPETVDLSSRFPDVGDQGELGSCVSWAVGYAARSYYGGLASGGRPNPASIPSPAYIHSKIGVLGNGGGTDRRGNRCRMGARIPDAFNLLRESGAASINDMPYSDKDCRPPSDDLDAQVAETKPFSIRRMITYVNTDEGSRETYLDQIKAELARGHPVVVGMYLDKAFHQLRGKKGKNIWQHSGPIDEKQGHAFTLVGYDEKGQYFKFINSWGTDWGDRGFGRIGYRTVSDLRQQPLAYAMRVPGIEPPQPEPAPDRPDPTTKPPQIAELELPEVSCGLLTQSIVDGKHTVAGFVPEQVDIDRIKAAIGTRDIRLDVALRPWPQCEALMTLRDPLKDQGKPSVTLPAASYKEGDTLSFKVGMAPFEGYLHVAYVQADRNIVNLVQQGATNIQTIGRGTELTFGDGEQGRAKFTVSEPYGQEMVIAIASASPLFPEPRPAIETERTFLTALRAAILARPDPDLPERRISAAYATLETKGDPK